MLRSRGEGGGGYSLLWPIRVGSTRRKGVKNSFKFQIPFCEIIRFEQYCSKVLPKRFYLNGNTTAFHPKVKTIIAIEWFVALVFQGIQPPYRWGTRVTKRASDREWWEAAVSPGLALSNCRYVLPSWVSCVPLVGAFLFGTSDLQCGRLAVKKSTKCSEQGSEKFHFWS